MLRFTESSERVFFGRFVTSAKFEASRSRLDTIHLWKNCEVVEVEGEEIEGTCLCGRLILAGEPNYHYCFGDEERLCLVCLKADEGFIFGVRSKEFDQAQGGWVQGQAGSICNFSDVRGWDFDVAVDYVREFSSPGEFLAVYAIQVDAAGQVVQGSAGLVFDPEESVAEPVEEKAGGDEVAVTAPEVDTPGQGLVAMLDTYMRYDMASGPDSTACLGPGMDLVDGRCAPGSGCVACEQRYGCTLLESEADVRPSKVELRRGGETEDRCE